MIRRRFTLMDTMRMDGEPAVSFHVLSQKDDAQQFVLIA